MVSRWLILTLVFFVGCGDSRRPRRVDAEPQPQPAKNDPDSGVRGAGYEIAKKVLKPVVPLAATFPWESVNFKIMDPVTDKLGETAKRWLVSGRVDKQTTSTWEVVLLGVKDNFLGAEVRLDGNIILQIPSYKNMIAAEK